MNEIKNLKELVYSADERFGGEIFTREIVRKQFQDRSFHQFRLDCDAVGAWLQELFPEQRAHISLVGTTSNAYLTAWFGIQCGNHVSVPLDASNSTEKIADEINRSDSVLVFLDEKHAGELETFRTLCPAVKYFVSLPELPAVTAPSASWKATVLLPSFPTSIRCQILPMTLRQSLLPFLKDRILK